MAVARREPYKNFRFRIEIDGVVVAGFSEVAIGEEPAVSANRRRHRKLPGLTKFGTITLKRGVADRQLIAPLLDGSPDRSTTILIRITDDLGSDQGRWLVSRAWPSKLQGPEFNAKGNEVLIDLIELTNEGIERTC